MLGSGLVCLHKGKLQQARYLVLILFGGSGYEGTVILG